MCLRDHRRSQDKSQNAWKEKKMRHMSCSTQWEDARILKKAKFMELFCKEKQEKASKNLKINYCNHHYTGMTIMTQTD